MTTQEHDPHQVTGAVPQPDPPASVGEAPVVELRQYTLHPGQAPVLVDLFEREFIETQEAVGMTIGGLFRDRDDPDRFVWWRGFASMETRRQALEAFYGGPVWARHRAAANATMIDSDDVHLLRPTAPAHPPTAPVHRQESAGATESAEWHVAVAYTSPPSTQTEAWLCTDLHALLEDRLGTTVAMWRTEPATNTFPALPVREDNTLVWTAAFPDAGAHDEAFGRLAADPLWRREIGPRIAETATSHRTLRLQPTSRSRHPACGLREPTVSP